MDRFLHSISFCCVDTKMAGTACLKRKSTHMKKLLKNKKFILKPLPRCIDNIGRIRYAAPSTKHQAPSSAYFAYQSLAQDCPRTFWLGCALWGCVFALLIPPLAFFDIVRVELKRVHGVAFLLFVSHNQTVLMSSAFAQRQNGFQVRSLINQSVIHPLTARQRCTCSGQKMF